MPRFSLLRGRFALGLSLLALTPALRAATPASTSAPIRVAIVGLVHGHVKGFLSALPSNPNATLVAIVEPDTTLAAQYAADYHLDKKLFYTDTEAMLTQQHPDAVLVYTTIRDHREVIEIAARHGVSSMVEKPLSTTLEDAIAIRDAARQYHVQVLVNYETTWYPSNAEALKEVADGKLGTVRKVVVHDGHEGPKEIGVGPEWLPWLTDPAQNGAGALFDFGCYGADLMTVLKHGTAPLTVTAVTQTDKPAIYPNVDDDATVILRYADSQAVLMPSWNWSFARKDMEVYGDKGSAITVAADHLRVRYAGDKAESAIDAPPLPTCLSRLPGISRRRPSQSNQSRRRRVRTRHQPRRHANLDRRPHVRPDREDNQNCPSPTIIAAAARQSPTAPAKQSHTAPKQSPTEAKHSPR